MKLKEKTIENGLYRFYSRNFDAKRQVRISSKQIDIVTKCPVTHEVWAIEVKISDWKGGLQQAILNTLACDKSYVAVWHVYANAAIKNSDVFSNNGIGLIVVNEHYEPEIIVNSRYCNNINPHAYYKVANSL